MQILFERGVEHGVQTDGVGEWPGTVERLQAPIVPHMGWNTVSPGAGSVLFDGLDPRTRFYFVHSYAVRRWELEVSRPFTPPVVTWAEHGGDRFVAAVENGPLSATQFHPEKSGDAGAEVLRRWVRLDLRMDSAAPCRLFSNTCSINRRSCGNSGIEWRRRDAGCRSPGQCCSERQR